MKDALVFTFAFSTNITWSACLPGNLLKHITILCSWLTNLHWGLLNTEKVDTKWSTAYPWEASNFCLKQPNRSNFIVYSDFVINGCVKKWEMFRSEEHFLFLARKMGWCGNYVPGKFKLDHLQSIKPTLFSNFSNFSTFILGGQFLLPQRANIGKREFIQLQNWMRQRVSSVMCIQTGPLAAH